MNSSTKIVLSTITCTHEPRIEILERVLDSLLDQSDIAPENYEILVVDNRSAVPVIDRVAPRFLNRVRFVREEELGLTHARLRGLREASADLLVMVDDDNVLCAEYLTLVCRAFGSRPRLGALGGKAIAVFATTPPAWFNIASCSLGCRDLGDLPLQASWDGIGTDQRAYPACAPIGGGMAIRRAPFETYKRSLATSQMRRRLDRTGNSLASGGDNDIVMTVLSEGLEVGYEPALRLDHYIPSSRLATEYLKRYQRDSTRTWVQVLAVHGIRPWPPIARWTVGLRKARAYFRLRAWQSIPAMLAWQSACGMLEGQATLRDSTKQ